MKKVYVYIIVLMVVVAISCKEEVAKVVVLDENNVLEVNIVHSAGDNWSATDNFLPLPFNVAAGGTEKIIVLSNRIKTGESIDVKPIGAVRILQNDTLITYVVTTPIKAEYKTISAADFDEFSTVYSSEKWIVEQYLINRKDSHSIKLKSWENENFAIKYLLK